MADTGMDGPLSRAIRLAAGLRGEEEAQLDHLFADGLVLIRLEDAFACVPVAVETFLAAVNQVARFCPNISVCAAATKHGLIHSANAIVTRIHGGTGRAVRAEDFDQATRFTAVINIGTEILQGLRSVTVNSTGWVARIATPGTGATRLAWTRGTRNPIGAVGAASFGAAHAFAYLAERPLPTSAMELSLFDLTAGDPGALHPGPELPRTPLELDAFLIGCGAVSNGWAYVVKRLPIVGKLQAIDRQSFRSENLGPYTASGREWLGNPKAEMLASYLSPEITVTPRADEWELFRIRLRHGLAVPALVVNGLDNVGTRHSVQRIWPETLVDMAAGGLTTQVIVKHRNGDGVCLLGALHRPPGEISWAERAARETGLSVERILHAPTTTITEADVAQAPEEKRAELEEARRRGQPVCGRVTQQQLLFERHDPTFAPAVPFVTGLSGAIGGAATMRWLMERAKKVEFQHQFTFASFRGRQLGLLCADDCECHSARSSFGGVSATASSQLRICSGSFR